MSSRFGAGCIVPFLVLFAVHAVEAQVRTWVATNGIDTNPCTRAEPCRTFDQAVAAVATGGEVAVLDSGGYGPVLITKSVSLIAPPGIHAAIAPTAGVGIDINNAGAKVIVRGIYLNSQGGSVGIRSSLSESVHIENCVVTGSPRTESISTRERRSSPTPSFATAPLPRGSACRTVFSPVLRFAESSIDAVWSTMPTDSTSESWLD